MDSGNQEAASEDWLADRSHSDEAFKQTMADLSDRLATRLAAERPPDESEWENEARRSDPSRTHPFKGEPERPSLFRLRGIRASDFAIGRRAPRPLPEPEPAPPQRGRTLRLLLGFTLGATAAIGGLVTFHTATQHPAPPPAQSHQAAKPAAKPTSDMGAVVPPPATLPKPPSANDLAAIDDSKHLPSTGNSASAAKPAPEPSSSPPSPPSSPAPTAPQHANAPSADAATANTAPLAPYEIMEVQTRLQWLGFSPGGLDGISGRLTAAAVRRYEASKGQPQTGAVDQSLLKELRQDSLKPAKP